MYYLTFVCFPSLSQGLNVRMIYETFDRLQNCRWLSVIYLHKRISIKTIREIQQLQNSKTSINVDELFQ